MEMQCLPQLHVKNKKDVPEHVARAAVSTGHLCKSAFGNASDSKLPVAATGANFYPQVVSIGEALFDLISDQKGFAREDVQSWTPYAGGAPCNVATGLAQLGVTVCFVSSIGKDEYGQELLKIMEERGVDLSGVQLRDEPTRDVYVTRNAAGDRTFAGFGLPTNKYSDCYIDLDRVPLDAVRNAQLLITGTLGLAYPETRKCMEAAVELARSNRRLVFIDINWRPMFWNDLLKAKAVILKYLESADIVKISDDDLLWLYDDIDVEAALKDPSLVAVHLPNATIILVTAGEHGAAYHVRTRDGKPPITGFIDAFNIAVADTTGAGDAFTAGFVLQLLRQGGLESLQADAAKLHFSVKFGAGCGALVCTKPGAIAGQPSEASVLELLAKH